MSKAKPRITGPTLKVLGAFLSSPARELSGAEIARTTKLASGTLYPILARLEGVQWLSSHWEGEDPAVLGRPKRRMYQLTGIGAARARATFNELTPGAANGAWAWA